MLRYNAATGEVSDMQLEYLQPEQLGLQPSDLPKQGRWPYIRAPKWPFSGDLVSPPSFASWQPLQHFDENPVLKMETLFSFDIEVSIPCSSLQTCNLQTIFKAGSLSTV